jgi:hypothetical protein
MTLAPSPQFAERQGTVYERKVSPALPGERGPLRFQEGLGTDTDVPNEFSKGAMQGYVAAPGRPNRNMNVFEKWPEETMRERAHVGSASWVEAPSFLGEFAHGSFADYATVSIEQVDRAGGNILGQRFERANPAEVND